MFILNKFSKFFCNFSFKFLLAAVVLLLFINFLLFFNLKFIENEQYKSKQKTPKSGKIRSSRNKDNHGAENKPCKIGNYTSLYSEHILQLKDKLGEFYSKTPHSTVLFERCSSFVDAFSSKIDINESIRSFLKINNEINFADGRIGSFLKTSAIFKVENAKKGSQLKLLLHLTNNITAIFKPKWYSPFKIIHGSVYAGKDRHYGEFLAFFLSILLNFRRVPVTVNRKLDVKNELQLLSDLKLRETFVTKNNSTCLYGVCHYCNPSDLLCTNSATLEGAVIFHLPSEFKIKYNRHPWQRTYKCDKLAKWEMYEDYCSSVRASSFYLDKRNLALFYDLVEISIFDFLIDNGDRHHYESIEINQIPRIIIIDNGKSFGNPYKDHIDILAPLYQCCVLRNSTWNNLLHLRGGNLSTWLKYLIKNTEGDIVLNEMHFQALDRRLLIVFAVLKDCFARKGMQNVLSDFM